MNRKLSIALAALLLSVLSVSRADAASGLYIGAGLGQSTVKTDVTGSGEFDASDAAYKAFVGYRFNLLPIFDLAAEAGYTDFGKPSQSLGGQNAQFKLHGADAAGLLIFPLGPFDLYGKVGVLSWSLDSNTAGTSRARPAATRSMASAPRSTSGRWESAPSSSSTRSRTSIACRCIR